METSSYKDKDVLTTFYSIGAVLLYLVYQYKRRTARDVQSVATNYSRRLSDGVHVLQPRRLVLGYRSSIFISVLVDFWSIRSFESSDVQSLARQCFGILCFLVSETINLPFNVTVLLPTAI